MSCFYVYFENFYKLINVYSMNNTLMHYNILSECKEHSTYYIVLVLLLDSVMNNK